MNIVLVDNVNNLSGAPMVARSIAAALGAPIFCIRQTRLPMYKALTYGFESEQRWNYFIGILGLVLSLQFWRQWLPAQVVICNTCLTFPYALVSRILGKRVVCVIHESASKNILYRVALWTSKKVAHQIVTPSKLAYQDIGIPPRKWHVIPNALMPQYSVLCRSVASHTDEVRILFVGGGRDYKGAPLFSDIQAYCQLHHPQWQLHAVGDEAFARTHGPGLQLTPVIYGAYHAVLVLTDNRVWKETFGLVGCEAAACRCLPLFTDRFAYAELWSDFADQLFLPTGDAQAIAGQLVRLLADRPKLDKLRDAVRQHALNLTDAAIISDQWHELVIRIDHQLKQ
jgi:glycosyltransferase involved in cell wall biosynthesis